MAAKQPGTRIAFADLGREPFRIFFPMGVIAGIIGVALWPLHFANVLELYPGLGHARIMAYGLFGAFIFSFLGTAMPRMLSAQPLHAFQVMPLVGVHAAMVSSSSDCAKACRWPKPWWTRARCAFARCC